MRWRVTWGSVSVYREPEQYKKFFKEFGTSVKLGLIEDYANRTRLAKLLRFRSSNDKEEFTSLEDYVERMTEKQKAIYFAAGTSREELEKQPFVEKLLKRGYEVLYLVEPVDEYVILRLCIFFLILALALVEIYLAV